MRKRVREHGLGEKLGVGRELAVAQHYLLAVAGDEQHAHLGPHGAQALRERRARHLRQHHVGEEEIDPRLAS